jgi:uncharacterized protein YceH (UPF0502 family)
LSLNATTAGCNQKSNRSPVLQLSETEVQMQLDKLVVAGLAGRVHPATSRVERFRHNLCEHFDLDSTKAAILAELMMRGPQTRGDLRTRASRMQPIDTLEQLATHLDALARSGFVQRIPPAVGSRAERFVQCLAPGAHALDEAPARAQARPGGGPGSMPPAQVVGLEARVAKLERQLADLAEKLGEDLDGN